MPDVSHENQGRFLSRKAMHSSPHPGPVTVVYIMGASHSGSTLLDIILGNLPEIVSVGELTKLVRNAWITPKYCGCGKLGDKCQFWSDVREWWTHELGFEGAERYLKLQHSFEHFRNWARLHGEMKNASKSSRFLAYAEYTRALLEAIGNVSGKRVVVDSSKSPVRALALSLIPDIELRLVHLVRDARGVAWSLRKKGKKRDRPGRKVIYSSRCLQAFNWSLVNLCCEYVLSRSLAKGTRIKYEDLVEQPKTFLSEIGSLIEIDTSRIADDLVAGKEMRIGHTVGGNRIRLNRSIRLGADYEWKKRLSKREQQLFCLLAGVLARRYGYCWNLTG